jgi:hypothetical protein
MGHMLGVRFAAVSLRNGRRALRSAHALRNNKEVVMVHGVPGGHGQSALLAQQSVGTHAFKEAVKSQSQALQLLGATEGAADSAAPASNLHPSAGHHFDMTA